MAVQAAISPGLYVAQFIDWLNVHYSSAFTFTGALIDSCVKHLEDVLRFPPAFVVIFLTGALALRISGPKPALFSVLGLAFCWLMNLWSETMLTAALVIVSVGVALSIAIPLGVLSARSDAVEWSLRPLLDFLQTMPPWVYLIPGVILFGLGRAPAVIATVIYALPPPLRLTNIGIREVLAERKELGQACGASPMQVLLKIEIPSALPAIMAGVNQCIMFALSMVVLAGLIGAGGLGGTVTLGLTRMLLGVGVRGGLAIVVLAMMFDRVSQGAVRRFSQGADLG